MKKIGEKRQTLEEYKADLIELEEEKAYIIRHQNWKSNTDALRKVDNDISHTKFLMKCQEDFEKNKCTV